MAPDAKLVSVRRGHVCLTCVRASVICVNTQQGFAKFVVEPYLHLPFPVQATCALALASAPNPDNWRHSDALRPRCCRRYLAAYSQLIGSAGLILGFQTRASAAAIGVRSRHCSLRHP